MPHQISRIADDDVREILRKRGYSFHGNRLAGIHLSRRDPNPKNRFKTTGQAKVILQTAVSIQHYEEIMRKAADPVEAADQIEAISTGRQLAPNFHGGIGIDAGVIETMVMNRVGNEVAKAMEARDREIADLQAKLEETAQPEPAAKKRGRPKGSKNKPKAVVAKKPAEPEDPDAEPELTPEQQAMFDQLRKD